jgi:hypothetical protein
MFLKRRVFRRSRMDVVLRRVAVNGHRPMSRTRMRRTPSIGPLFEAVTTDLGPQVSVGISGGRGGEDDWLAARVVDMDRLERHELNRPVCPASLDS